MSWSRSGESHFHSSLATQEHRESGNHLLYNTDGGLAWDSSTCCHIKMVNTGKPSQGCGTCRARRIKCDEAKPTCLRCVKANRHCSGYRRPEELHGLLGRKRKGSRPHEVQSNSGDLVRTLFIGPSARLPSIPSYLLQMSQSSGSSAPRDSGLSTPIMEQAVNYFINKFVLSPSRGNSRSYMEFVLPAVDNILSLPNSNSPLASAVLAVSLASLATRPNSRSLLPMASTQYSKALHQMNRVLQDPELALKDQTLATVIILTLYEVLTGSAAQPGGWCSHTDGAIVLVKVREKCETLSPEGRILHVMARGQMTVNCIISSRRPTLGVDWWMKFGSKDGLPAVCAKLNLEVAELHADINKHVTNADHSPVDHEKTNKLLYLAQDLERRYKSWESNLPPTWQYHTLAWMNSVDDEKLQDSHTFPGRVDEYTDINIAAAWNMMRAARIMLNADIIRCRAWLSPSTQDYRISPEYMTAARTSRSLIDDLISSAPAFLGFAQGTQDDGGLNGKSAFALFILWPLFVTTISDFVSNAQRKWALGRLRYMSDVIGIKQAALYSMFEIRLPSMFVYRDKMTEVYGKQEAIKRTMELTKIKSPGLEIEAEIVVAGILGCIA